MNTTALRIRRIYRRCGLKDIPRAVLRLKDRIKPDHFAKDVYPTVRERTMLRYEALHSLYEAVRRVVERNIPGNVVECGVAMGGSGATMATALAEADADRLLFLFDTFEGLPCPTRADPDYERAIEWTGKCRGDIKAVQSFLSGTGVTNYRLIKGRFEETLEVSDTGTIGVLHLDGDWYESTRACLEALWDRVAVGGFVQIDDYGGWQGCRKAVDEFFERRRITPRLQYVDPTARSLIKSQTDR